MTKLTLLITATIFSLTSCYYDVESELYPNQNCDTPATLVYATDVAPIIANSCGIAGCHVSGGTGTGNFETYEGVKAKVDDGSFEARTFVQKNMPPTPLNTCDLELLQAWVAAGAQP
ncbi:MAG: hypothetical protein GC193_04625 [Cryomorphaceae bacterium]|nr:hypothetical protein [Cryomorphaceae bacterium]